MGARRLIPPSLLLAVAAPIFLACGSNIETPDLTAGEVSGRIVGADPATAQVYVVGRPDVRTSLSADGSFTLRGVPAGSPELVLFDGVDRAERVTVQVAGANRAAAIRRDREEMPLAGRVVVVPRCAGGARGDGAAFTLEGTPLTAVQSSARGVALFPVPAGDWQVRGELSGFRRSVGAVRVASGASEPLELPLEIGVEDPPIQGGGAPQEPSAPTGTALLGCAATVCTGRLECDPADGRCYGCVGDAHCGAGLRCDRGACVPEQEGHRTSCEPCTSDASCDDGGVCVIAAGASEGTCAARAGCDSDAECEAGLACRAVAGTTACVPPAGCDTWRQAFGAGCLVDAWCSAVLAGGRCAPVVAARTSPGYCTAPCGAGCPEDLGLTCRDGACVPEGEGN